MSSNIMTITEYVKLINNSDYQDNYLFHTVLNVGMVVLSLSEKDCAEMFDVSRSSVNCWINRKTTPHTVIRRLVFKELKLKAELTQGG